ncbi:hypothetical protein [Piscinibacter sakaiensis]|uniref:hypothetical protein n=1 Tax=Piscinibacter sakaiensis TaxID=1547922 RepID=UPI003AAC22A2
MALNDNDLAAVDVLPAALRPDRLYYDTGVLLDRDDFVDEQTYHRSRLARALGYLGGSGTLVGLKVVAARPAPGLELQVGGGLAVDRFGRLIEVPRPWCLRLAPWVASKSSDALRAALGPAGVVADLYLRFVSRGRGATPAFAHGAYDATDALVPSRVRDAFVFELVLRPEAKDDPAATNHLPRQRFAALRAMAPADRPNAVRAALLDGWDDALARPNGESLAPLQEHAVGVDAAAVFLARLRLPAGAPDADGRPVFDLDSFDNDHIDNESRAFVVPNDMLAAVFAA